MGSILNELRRTAVARALKNFLGDTRSDGGIERYSETLQPVIDLWSQPEAHFLRSEITGAAATGPGAVAAQFGSFGVGIAATSDIIAVVEAMTFVPGGILIIERLTHATLAAAVATLAFSIPTRDRRGNDFVAGVELFSGTSATATLGQGLERLGAVAGVSVRAEVTVPYVLVPGQAIVGIAQTANLSISGSVKLRSRQRLRTERV